MTGAYDAVVYDLDGTLVRLDVDWDAAAEDAAELLSTHGFDTEGMNLWDVLELATEEGYRGEFEEAVARHERDGARRSRYLRLADQLPTNMPVAVCSLNCEAACRLALEVHGIDDRVDVVVGRDTTGTYKPDPEPLLLAIRRLSADPGRSLFVGDTERDEETARRAGVPFRYAGDL